MDLSTEQVDPLVSIAIVTWNRSAEVLRAIQSVYDQDYHNFEIVIADNHSSDSTRELIEKQFPDVKVIRLHRNMGACVGRNISLANCKGEIIFGLDDDALLHNDTLPNIVDFFAKADPNIGLVACQIFENGQYKFPPQSGETGSFEGCGWAIRRSVLADEKVDYFSDQLFRASEETQFAYSYFAAGYQMWYLSEATIDHMPSKVRVAEEVSFYKCRNEVIIIFERYPILLVLPFAIWLLLAQVKFGIQHPSHLSYIIRGYLSGLSQAVTCFARRQPVTLSVLKKVRFSPMNDSKFTSLIQKLPL